MLKRFRDVAAEKLVKDVQKAVEAKRMELRADRRRKLAELRTSRAKDAEEVDFLTARITLYQDLADAFPQERKDHEREILRMKNRMTFLLTK